MKAVLWGSLFAGALLLAMEPAGAVEKRVALVLGNARYAAAAGEVATVGVNAAAMAAALRKAGFSVTRADNLGRVAMESALERFRESLSGADLGFVYYSGLAVGVEEREYLLPTDAAPATAGDLPRDALDLDALLGDLRGIGRRTVVALDPAGGDNPLAERVGGGALGTPLEADGLFVIYAHRPGVPPVAATGKGPDAFTAALAREIVKPGVPLRDSLAEVARAVATRSGGRQLPWLQDRLGGDLVLVPAVVAAVKPVPKEPPKEPPAKEASPAPPNVPAALSPGRYEAVRGGMLFERPAVGARGVAPLARGDAVTVIEAVPQGSWVRVRDAAGRIGYVTAGTLSERWGEPPPPVAALPRGAVEAGPSSEPSMAPDGVATLPPSGASDPQGADGPAGTAEQRAMQAVGSARTAAERARGGRGGHWSYQFPNGDRYEGAWSQSEGNGGLGRPSREGFGVYRFANGQTYEGEWSRDLMSGYGVMTFLDGSRFAGRFRDGQPDGPGVFRFGDGSRSAGLWRGPVKLDD
ncbi:caspase family protein [Azospirillum doebereinerae]|uniref:caspase family protein n=1 Tax=Azospirillum doebereinerae TaxID=92933 RepID=UPI001FD295F1|nr:caspase family protein [Azospirillum doebereinerae]